MIVSTITPIWTRTIIRYLRLSLTINTCLDVFKLYMITDDNFCRLNERMIGNDSISVSSLAKNGLKMMWQMVKLLK